MGLNIINKPAEKEQKWYYTDEVKDHFYDPRNLHKKSDAPINYDGVGMVGSPACGDYMKMWVKVDAAQDKIVECKWQTFGCASAIGSTSMLSVMVSENGGMKIEEALKIKPTVVTDSAKLVKALQDDTSSKTALVVGHSNTLPDILKAFGSVQKIEVGENEYDRLYILTPQKKAKPIINLIRY